MAKPRSFLNKIQRQVKMVVGNELLVKLQRQTDRTSGRIVLHDDDLERIPRYAFTYGNGGWEDRLTTIFSRHLGARLNQ